MRSERRFELRAAVAAAGMEDVAGQALRVHAHEHVLAVADLAADERNVRLVIDLVLVGEDAERAVLGRQLRRRDALDEPLGPHAVPDQVRDRDHQQAVLLRELRQLRHARHRAVVVHDFADDARRIETGDARQIDGRLGLTGAHHDAAVARAQRKHVTGPRQVRRLRLRVDRRLHRARRGPRPRCRCSSACFASIETQNAVLNGAPRSG